MSFEGSIREENCPTHKHFEWDVGFKALRESNELLKSPIFKIEKQSCMLQAGFRTNFFQREYVYLNLLFMDPGDAEQLHTERCWLGLKGNEGTYRYMSQTTGKLEVYGCKSSSESKLCFSITRTDLERWHLTSDEYLTFFFRVNAHQASAGGEKCIHGPSPIPAPSSGSIREEECSTHTQVEWEVNYERHTMNEPILTSPGIEIGCHVYFLESHFLLTGCVTVVLYSLGPPVAASARCWLGLKCANGSYTPDVSSNVFDMREDLGLWTQVISHTYSKKVLEDRHLAVDKRLRFFFRLNMASSKVETCTHGIPSIFAPVSGSIREERCSSLTQVEWNVRRETLPSYPVKMRSSVFQIASQLYFFNLYITDITKTLELFRQGCSMARSVEWQAGLRFSVETCPSRNFSGTLNLREEFGLWTKTDIFGAVNFTDLSLLHMFPDNLMTVFFRINATRPVEEAYINDVVDVAVQVDREETDSLQDGNLGSSRGAEKVLQDIGTLLKSGEYSDVVIKVGNADFKAHRTILAVRAPVLGAMFQHDTKEKATGEVTIDDCEPAVFEELLHYIYTGAPRELTAENASAVYAVADKYLLSEVTALCVKRMKDTLGVNNFCGIVTLALMHKEEELLDTAIGFLSGHMLDVLKTVEWQVLNRDHSTWANEIMIRALELQARNGREIPPSSD